MKRKIFIIVLIFTSLILTNSVVTAKSLAKIEVKVEGGFGINVEMRNSGNLPASNITYCCIADSERQGKTIIYYYEIDDILPDKEIHIRNFVFFIGRITIGAGASSYFNGEEQLYLDFPVYYALALGPFIIMEDYPY